MTDTQTTALPTWDEMSDLDKGAALLHEHHRAVRGVEYATTRHPCRYFDDQRLVSLDRQAASDHAAKVCGMDIQARIGAKEILRLSGLALDHAHI